MDYIRKKEETALWQRSMDRKIVLGGRNNFYFHGLANQHHRINHLDVLIGDDSSVYSTHEMLEVATSFYKNLFGFEVKDNIHLGHDFWSDSDLVTDEENDKLQQPLSEEGY